MLHLASQSPQRADLLRRAGIEFTIVPSHGDEETVTDSHAQRLALERARVKGRGAVVSDGLVLAADTVVAVSTPSGVEMLGKPADEADARAMLARLGGTQHSVITGHWVGLFAHGTVTAEACAVALAKVTMRPLSGAEIDAYIASGEWRARAGGYAIQETGDQFVVDIQGSKDTVIGLHVAMVQRLLAEVAAVIT